MKNPDPQSKAEALLSLIGLSYSPAQGYRPAGNTASGQQLYTSSQLASSADLTAGAKLIHVLASIVFPFNVLNKKEKEAINHLATISKDKKVIDTLNEDSLNRSLNTFSKTILSTVKSNTEHKAGMESAKLLYDAWGIMSPAQKSLAIASLGVQTHQASEVGGPICNLKIISGEGQTFTVQNALDLLKAGKNPYGLVLNWEQIRKLNSVYNGDTTPEAMFNFADSHNLLGKGTNDAAIVGVSKKAIEQSGGKAAPQYGVGALAIPKGKTSPQGYTKTAQLQGGDLISPTPNTQSAAGALQASLTDTQAGNAGISSGAANIYSKWNKTDKIPIEKGAEGGSALIAGATSFKKSDPYLYGAMVAFITHYAKDQITHSNPVDYSACLAAIALSRIVSGGKEAASELEGVQIAKNIASKTPAEFAKVQTNLKGLYASFGVSSKADAYQLANQAYGENRINELDLVAMHEIFNIVYDQDGLATAQKLMHGKDKGLSIARDKTPPAKNRMVEGQKVAHKEVLAQMTKDEARKKNAAKYAQQQAQGGQQPEQGQEAEGPAEQDQSSLEDQQENSLSNGGSSDQTAGQPQSADIGATA